ncbi:hypothetical protein BCF59_0337 [Mycoplasmopsis mustelae]|uniref:Inhibitor of apoptosis-promoting Bax1 n=1 Tax=Mycoplasmopsis mustelae TaxID=171289 RepID=A0A4R7UD23_9BACT|nr:hypothetical protein [Mycoplasmopsis mustelae]TDV24372.1 hypothetical protein BCF59_0337 [Mycoplasmopsis mustelae]
MRKININVNEYNTESIIKIQKRKIWGISLAIMAFSFIVVVIGSLFFQYALKVYLKTNIGSWTPQIIIFVGFFLFIILNLTSHYTKKINGSWLYIYYVLQLVAWTLILTSILFYFTYIYELDSITFLAIALLPLGIILISGLIGYFQLIKEFFLYFFIGILSVALLVMFFVSIFVFRITWYYSLVSVILISAITVADIMQAKKEVENVVWMDSNIQFRFAFDLGIRLFISAAMLLFYILQLFMSSGKR